MRKLKLDINTLRVESFQACAGDGRTLGTVRGNMPSPDYSADGTCFEDTCACANTSPRPSCIDCSWEDVCISVPPQCD
jgi:hypothetical protein